MPNDCDDARPDHCTVEIWRNLVLPRRGFQGRVLTAVTRLFGGPFYHLFLVVRYGDADASQGDGEVGRFEIYEPEIHPPRDGDWRLPISFGGFLQRRACCPGYPKRQDDPDWDLHLVWARNYPCPAEVCERLREEALASYRWRDHYPKWFDNMRGGHINSNTFVEKVVREFGLENADGSPIDLTDGGRCFHPGLGLTEGWDYAWAGETEELHEEWQSLHAHPPIGRRRWFLLRQGLRARFVRPEVAGGAEA